MVGRSNSASPVVSVVIPAYNAERFLAETVESVLGQTFPSWELIIVDDGSTDTTAEIASSFEVRDKRVRLVRQENRGVASARNIGFARSSSRTRYVTFVDADDLYEPDAFEILISALEENLQAVAVHGRMHLINAWGQPITDGAEDVSRGRPTIRGWRLGALPTSASTTFASICTWLPIYATGQGLIRRSALERMGPIDESVTIGDYDMWLRLSLQSEIPFVDRVVLRYRRHNDSMAIYSSRRWREEWYLRRKLVSSCNLTLEQRRVFLLANLYSPAYFRLSWALQALRARRPKEALSHVRHLLGAYARLAGLLPPLLLARPQASVRST
jgi:glycosyltransferase involved in cell wall biosynthesis